jgi:mono/diheme cytochrome c family protein
MKLTFSLGVMILIGILGYTFWNNTKQVDQVVTPDMGANTALAKVILPETFSENAKVGKLLYEAKCVACHAVNASGQDGVAPPLVHKIYEPSHHWRFGNMLPVEGLTRGDVKMITAYVRELQRANGIN